VALIAGTGSLAYAVSREGGAARAGGWGYLFGDEGSGHWIAVEGLRAATHAADGRGPATRLLPRLMERFKVAAPLELIRAIYPQAQDRAAIASFADVVFRAAEEYDAPAMAILEHAADELAAMVVAAARNAGLSHEPVPLATTGGVLLRHEPFFAQVCERVRERGAALASATRVENPVWGAVLLARREAEL
jgi:N-acetylglucosamine kinase-like BadF-type ATPase